MELKDKVKGLSAQVPHGEFAPAPAQGAVQEAMDALEGLGYATNEAKAAIQGIDSDDVEVLLKAALKRLAMKG